MIIEKNTLKYALETVKPGLANKEVIEQSTSFAFIDGKVVTYNDEISVSHPIDLDITGAIQAEALYKYISKVKETEIELSVVESELVLKCGRAKSGFALSTEIKLPIDEELSEKSTWHEIPNNFLEHLLFASKVCSKNSYDNKLTCVHVDAENGIIEASDNYRIAHCHIPKIPIQPFLLPFTSASIIFQSYPLQIAEGKGWIHFKNDDGTIVSCRTFDEKYVDTSNFFKKKKGALTVTFPDSLKEVIDRAVIFAKRDNAIEESVTIELSDKKVMVQSKSDTNWFKETIPFKHKGDAVTFSVTPYLLQDILLKMNSCSLVNNLLIFEGTDWTYVTGLRKSA
jgi:DNA polymerase III sliding clamp (beta) subunit (PCNA family)